MESARASFRMERQIRRKSSKCRAAPAVHLPAYKRDWRPSGEPLQFARTAVLLMEKLTRSITHYKNAQQRINSTNLSIVDWRHRLGRHHVTPLGAGHCVTAHLWRTVSGIRNDRSAHIYIDIVLGHCRIVGNWNALKWQGECVVRKPMAEEYTQKRCRTSVTSRHPRLLGSWFLNVFFFFDPPSANLTSRASFPPGKEEPLYCWIICSHFSLDSMRAKPTPGKAKQMLSWRVARLQNWTGKLTLGETLLVAQDPRGNNLAMLR